LPVPAFRLHFADDRMHVGIYRNVLISLWRSPPDAVRLRHFREAQKVFLDTPNPIGALTLIVPTGRPDFAELDRKGTRDLIAAAQGRPGGIAVVIEAGGFRAAAARAALSAIVLLAASQVPPLKIFSTRAEACSWLIPLINGNGAGHGPSATAADLEAAVATMMRGAEQPR
jgi:hypothetical protein